MSTLACLGGKPVTRNLLSGNEFGRRVYLERAYLLEAYVSRV
ncbi:MAG: hypothetical protein ONB17_02190 [candidate division KSB1 bacterium]|nr:hypothetical protein [candidate division KSB1 bacterium]MDZ7294259.1 hypothetical protein [candidate division KSB1 bacterium]MDZ7385795.1 hypothetical protein [candidate division KSB1 bacterium]MDZ7393840.1 hypothetical protein [candidate division KSB1 bacterium]MDZ7412775.1 hypothetical protein [candidate division KSB1 bacterium]